jgi:uracil-DNA glycosylase
LSVEASKATAVEMAKRLRTAHPAARYELDWETPEQLLVATMLAAGSKDSVVNAVTKTLFVRWPTLKSLAVASAAEVEQVLAPLGLAAQKTPRLIATAAALAPTGVPRSLEALTALPGIGRKTANVVLTQGYGLPSGVIVDVHVARLTRRMGLTSSEDADQIERELMELLPVESWVHFGAAGVLHGRYTCTAKGPRCPECVLADLCPSCEVATKTSLSTRRGEGSVGAAEGGWPEEYQLDGGPVVVAEPKTPDAMPSDWAELLWAELASPWYAELQQRVAKDRAAGNVYPPADQVFTAFRLTSLDRLSVVLLGQDPYHGVGQAHGLAFSVQPGVRPPPSLVNIYKELKTDLGCEVPATGCLESWARQGILLLNTALTVREGEAGSHAAYGWEKLTDAVIRQVSSRSQHTVFVLWGAHARKKAPLIDTTRHTVVEGAHPSPLSQKLWFGSRPFSQINGALQAHGQRPIDWSLT